MYSTSLPTFSAYSYSNWVEDINDLTYTTNLSVFLGSFLISCKSKKQSLVSCSFGEAGYVPLLSLLQNLYGFIGYLLTWALNFSAGPTPLPHIYNNEVTNVPNTLRLNTILFVTIFGEGRVALHLIS